jgi:nucleoside phosphorylase
MRVIVLYHLSRTITTTIPSVALGITMWPLPVSPAGVTGTISAARVATQMLSTFTKLRFGLMVGTRGGVPSEEHDIRLGDVVISQPTGTSGGVIQYDFGKTVQEGKFTRTGSLNKPPEVLLTALTNLKANHIREGQKLAKYLSEMMERYPTMSARFSYPRTLHDSLYEADFDHPNRLATCSQCDTSRLRDREPRSSEDPVVHYGLIASEDQVMKHGATRDRLRRELDVLCFDMEAQESTSCAYTNLLITVLRPVILAPIRGTPETS